MILTYSWISFFLFLYLIYLFLKKEYKGKEFRILVILFLIFYFFQFDAQLNDYQNVIEKFFIEKREVCDLTAVSSDCTTTISYTNNTYTQLYFNFLEQQFKYIDILSGLMFGAMIFLLWCIVEDLTFWFKARGALK